MRAALARIAVSSYATSSKRSWQQIVLASDSYMHAPHEPGYSLPLAAGHDPPPAVLLARVIRNARAPVPTPGCGSAAGYIGIGRHKCHERGCCWLPVKPSPHRPPIDVPWCVHQNSQRSQYAVDDVEPTGARRRSGHRVHQVNGAVVPSTPSAQHAQIQDALLLACDGHISSI